MEWISLVTRDLALGSIIAFVLAAVVVCWRSGSFHPASIRLLRLFISRDEIEDPILKKSLNDESAVVSFRMTYGVQTRTLKDAKELATFADNANIPLSLIGASGLSLTLDRLRLGAKHPPGTHKIIFVCLIFMVLFLATSTSLSFSMRKEMLVQIRESKTWIWLSPNEARPGIISFGKTSKFEKTSCNPPLPPPQPENFGKNDIQTLCKIWNSPELKDYLSSELPNQQKALLLTTAFFFFLSFMTFLAFRQCIARIELSRKLSSLASSHPTSIESVGDSENADEPEVS